MVLDANLSAGSRGRAAEGRERGSVEEGDVPDPVPRPARRHLAVHRSQAPAGAATAVVTRMARKPVWPSGLDGAPPEVREFLGRVLEEIPEGGAGVTGYQFRHWEWEGKPTHEAIGLKAIPGVDPQEVIARVMDVDRLRGPHRPRRGLPIAAGSGPRAARAGAILPGGSASRGSPRSSRSWCWWTRGRSRATGSPTGTCSRTRPRLWTRRPAHAASSTSGRGWWPRGWWVTP